MNNLNDKVKVINIGLTLFSEALRDQDTEVIQVDWQPGEKLEKEIEDILADLL